MDKLTNANALPCFENNGALSLVSLVLQDSLGNVPLLEHWRDANLPQSKTSIENALIMHHSPQWLILIDPQVRREGGKLPGPIL